MENHKPHQLYCSILQKECNDLQKNHSSFPSQCPCCLTSLTSMNNCSYWLHLISQLSENILLNVLSPMKCYSQLIHSFTPSHVFACWLLTDLVVVLISSWCAENTMFLFLCLLDAFFWHSSDLETYQNTFGGQLKGPH